MENIRDFAQKKASFKKYIGFLILAYIISAIVLAFNSKLILDFSLSIFYIVGIFVIVTGIYAFVTFNKKYGVAAVLVALVYIITSIVFSPIVSYKAHRNLIGEVEDVEFSNEIDHIDLKQLPIIDDDVAYKLADKKLGEIPSLGSQVTIGELTMQSVNGQLSLNG